MKFPTCPCSRIRCRSGVSQKNATSVNTQFHTFKPLLLLGCRGLVFLSGVPNHQINSLLQVASPYCKNECKYALLFLL